MCKSSARVDVISSEPPHPELQALADAGAVTIHARAFTDADVNGRLLVIGAAENDDALLARIAAAAKAARVPVNVVDRVDLSTFLMPAIVDRDPVVVAIGSGGSAPVLARAIRSRIEALLPARTGALAGSPMVSAPLSPVRSPPMPAAGFGSGSLTALSPRPCSTATHHARDQPSSTA